MRTAKRPTPRQDSFLRRDERAITPVVGTSLILVITVLGMAGVLFWGTPTLQGIQDRGSVVGMEGEFDELRRASIQLSVPDASRVPTVVMEDGSLSLEDGTRMMVAVARDTINKLCDFSVTGWETAGSDTLLVHADNCRSGTIEVHKITGSSTIEQTDVDVTATGSDYEVKPLSSPSNQDYGTGDWVVRLTNGGTTTYAEAWILEQKRITWRLGTSVTNVQLHLEGGAIFEVEDGAYFLHRPPPINEDAAANGDNLYSAKIITLLGADSGSAGRSTPEVFLGLVGIHSRTSTNDATQVRYAFHGDIAEAWCRSLLIRNDALAATPDPVREYTVDGACTDTTPHVLYRITDPVTGRETFPLDFFHARVTSSIRA